MANQTYSLTIGALAKTCGVSTPTIRYYEDIGLLPKAERNQGGQRRYVKEDVEKLTFIRRCRDFGFSTKQVRTLLLVPKGTIADCQASRDIATTRVNDIRSKVADLLALEKDLTDLIASCDATCCGQTDQDCAAFRDMRLPT